MQSEKALKEELSESAQIIPEIITTPGLQERLDSVKTLLCRGLDRTTILQYAAEMKWDSTPEQVDGWISAAQLQLAEDAGAIDLEAELGKSIARLNWLYMQATKVQDFKTALSIQKEINKMLALKAKARGGAGRTARPGETAQPARLKIVGK